MEQRCIREYAVEPRRRQVEPEKILLPHLAATVRPRHFHEARGTLQPDRHVAKTSERFQIASRPTAEIQNGERRSRFDVIQQCGDVLTNVMILRALAKIRGALIVVFERKRGYFLQVAWIELHFSACFWPSSMNFARLTSEGKPAPG